MRIIPRREVQRTSPLRFKNLSISRCVRRAARRNRNKNWHVNNWIVFLLVLTYKNRLKTYQYAKEQNFFQRAKDFHRN
jgi:hypothetical protein